MYHFGVTFMWICNDPDVPREGFLMDIRINNKDHMFTRREMYVRALNKAFDELNSFPGDDWYIESLDFIKIE